MKIKSLLVALGFIILVSGCSNTLRGMQEDMSQMKPNVKKVDQGFQDKYW